MSDSDNLFELLTKWSRREEKDPLENRLTAVLVAVAARAPIMRLELARLAGVDVAPGSPSGTIRMHPSAFDAQGRYCGQPDVELNVGGATIWWEVKLDSPQSGDDQLAKYERCLPGGPGNALVVLAPAGRRKELSKILRKRTRFVSWEQVLSQLESRSRAAGEQEQPLLREALRFFHMHGLDPTPPMLSTKLVNVLKSNNGAQAALEEALTSVAERVEAVYGVATIDGIDNEYKPRASNVKPGGWGNRARLVWSYEPTDVSVWAGLYYEPTAPQFTSDTVLRWLAALRDTPRWAEESGGRGSCYLGVYRDLAYFVGDGPDDPTDRIGKWILQVFEQIVVTRP